MIASFDMNSFCNSAAGVLQFVGYVLLIFKIFIPLIIIILGAIDFGKAVVAEKEDEIKKQAKRLLWRAIAGVCIFFVPNVVLWIFGTISEYGTDTNGFDNCQTCVLHPSNCVVTDSTN